MKTKRCSKCGKTKNTNLFYKTSAGSCEPQCRICRNARQRVTRLLKRKRLGLPLHTLSGTEAAKLLGEGKKYCPRCQTVKSACDFSTMRVRTGIASHCRACCRDMAKERNRRPDVKLAKHNSYKAEKRSRRNRVLMSKFGISIEEYECLHAKQNGVCAICGSREKNKSLAVDHDHTTGAVRALLCGRCNPAIGFLLEDVNYAMKLVEYIRQWTKEK